jgi:hypothetical protein
MEKYTARVILEQELDFVFIRTKKKERETERKTHIEEQGECALNI